VKSAGGFYIEASVYVKNYRWMPISLTSIVFRPAPWAWFFRRKMCDNNRRSAAKPAAKQCPDVLLQVSDRARQSRKRGAGVSPVAHLGNAKV